MERCVRFQLWPQQMQPRPFQMSVGFRSPACRDSRVHVVTERLSTRLFRSRPVPPELLLRAEQRLLKKGKKKKKVSEMMVSALRRPSLSTRSIMMVGLHRRAGWLDEMEKHCPPLDKKGSEFYLRVWVNLTSSHRGSVNKNIKKKKKRKNTHTQKLNSEAAADSLCHHLVPGGATLRFSAS